MNDIVSLALEITFDYIAHNTVPYYFIIKIVYKNNKMINSGYRNLRNFVKK